MEIIVWAVVFFLLVIYAIIRISKIITALKNIRDFFKSKNANIKKLIDSLELVEFNNDRFNYSFLAPKVWDRGDPVNNDGYSLVNPKNQNVQIIVYGSYFISNMIKEIGYNENKNRKFKLIQNNYSGLNAYEYMNDDNKILKKIDIEGERQIIQFKRGRDKMKALLFSTEYRGKRITIQCECPKNSYDLYEDLFYTIGKSLKILS